MRAAVVTPIMIAALAATGLAAADDLESPGEQADAFLQRGLAHYDEGNYELALVEFRAGYGIDPRPEFLFALAQAERLSGDCAAAIVYYERYLATEPDERQAEAARLNHKRCQRALESRPDALADPEGPPAGGEDDASDDVTPAPAPTEPPPRSPPWYRDVLTVSLVTGGAVSLGAGAWTLRAARGEAQRAGTADSYAAYADHMSQARTYRTIAWVGAGVSAAAFTGAVVRAVTHGGGGPERAVAAVAPLRDGALITIAGRF